MELADVQIELVGTLAIVLGEPGHVTLSGRREIAQLHVFGHSLSKRRSCEGSWNLDWSLAEQPNPVSQEPRTTKRCSGRGSQISEVGGFVYADYLGSRSRNRG